jgi:dynactin 1
MAAAHLDVKIGQTVETKDGKHGIVRYSGPLEIAQGSWLGLELPDQTGKNDGSVQGTRYFSCPQGYGIFIRKETVGRIVKQAPAALRSNGVSTNGSAVKPRPSTSGITAEAARKRQSMMSTGSATAASRPSLRVRRQDH